MLFLMSGHLGMVEVMEIDLNMLKAAGLNRKPAQSYDSMNYKSFLLDVDESQSHLTQSILKTIVCYVFETGNQDSIF